MACLYDGCIQQQAVAPLLLPLTCMCSIRFCSLRLSALVQSALVKCRNALLLFILTIGDGNSGQG
eukprot:1159302-Pelagomonas_calceolata.AAC.9